MSRVLPFPATRRRLDTGALADFALDWFEAMAVAWRPTTQDDVMVILRAHLLPAFGERRIDDFSRADVLRLRTRLAQAPGSSGSPRGARRINRIVDVLGQLLAERERQVGVPNPCRELRRLPQRRTAILPFSMPELGRLLEAAPDHLRDYLLVRVLTGLRSDEANGLLWDQVNWQAGTLTIAAARVRGQQVLPKNEYSERTINLLPMVEAALRRQWARTGSAPGFVFQTARGHALDTGNFASRDWSRILAAAALEDRAPEHLRHTAACLMLSAGEAPAFVARTLGHSDCRMLMFTYARFVPNALERVDGAAFDSIARQSLAA